MSNRLQLKLQVRQKLWSKVIFKTTIILVKCGLVSLEKAVSISNYLLLKGAFKYRVEKGEWQTLYNLGKIEIES